MTNEIYLTKEKKKELEEELADLTTRGWTEIADALEESKALWELKENAEYHQAREDQGHMEDRIREIENILKYGQIIKSGKHSVVEVGATVTFAKKGSSAKQTYRIIGEGSDPGEGTLSSNSPLVSAMMGKSEGEFFTFVRPDKEKIEYKIVSVA